MPANQTDYEFLRVLVALPNIATWFDGYFRKGLPERLESLWCGGYEREVADAEIVFVNLDGFTYVFDLAHQRAIGVYGIMTGKNEAPRPASRMRGHPKAEGRQWHRGHMIPHSGHGGTDINLFDQQGAINVGPFRPLEIRAVGNPGSFYFVHLLYEPGSARQRPSWVEQGLILPAPPSFEMNLFPN